MALKTFTVIEVDGTEHTVTPIFTDAVAADKFMRAHRQFGTQQDSPSVYAGARIHAALRREGRVTCDYIEFMDRIGDIMLHQDADIDPELEADFGGGATGESIPSAQ